VKHSEAQWSTVKHSEAQWSTVKHSEAQWNTPKHSEARQSTVKYAKAQHIEKHTNTVQWSGTVNNYDFPHLGVQCYLV
jgi:hypothetical protein